MGLYVVYHMRGKFPDYYLCTGIYAEERDGKYYISGYKRGIAAAVIDSGREYYGKYFYTSQAKAQAKIDELNPSRFSSYNEAIRP